MSVFTGSVHQAASFFASICHCPRGERFEGTHLVPIREGNGTGEKHGGRLFIPRAVLAVTDERKAAGGELHADLMRAPGMKANADK